MKYPFFFLFILCTLISCERVKDTAKKTINKTGEKVGQAAGEFVEGVSEGVEKTIAVNVSISPQLSETGISAGETVISSDSAGTDNLASIYLIFDKDYTGKVKATAFNKNNHEVGRTVTEVSGKTGEATFYDFLFHPRTNIDVKGKILLEKAD